MTYKVKVPASGHEFNVRTDESILQAALRQGIGLPYGCRNGACGKCAGYVISGDTHTEPEALRAMAKKVLFGSAADVAPT